MREQSKQLTVVYAGRTLLAPGDYLSEDVTVFGLSFTTQAEGVLDARRKVLAAHGNAEGSYELSTCEDFPRMEDAYARLLELSEFAEEHQTGVLTVRVGSQSRSWAAGLSGIDAQMQSTIGNKVRLIVRWPFVLGALVADD